jgi:putative chitinase
MMINKAIFYQEIRHLFGSLKPSQVKGMEVKIDYYDDNQEMVTLAQFAYVLATIFHETGQKMTPVIEVGKGIGKPYGKMINGKAYYGRGDVQITWIDNYKRVGVSINQDLVGNPGLCLVPSISVEIAMKGMALGWFTGKKLNDYITESKADFVNARRIINGTDKAVLISGYANKFLKALEKAKTD